MDDRSDALAPAVIAGDLLAFLRTHTGLDGVAYAEAPQRLTGGRDTLVFRFRLASAPGLDRPLVARVYPVARTAERAHFESAVHRALASQDYPAPAPLAVCERLEASGAPALLMDFVEGRSLLGDLERPRAMLGVPRLLAEAHLALHRLDARPVLESLSVAGVPAEQVSVDAVVARMEARAERCGLRLAAGLRWVHEHRPPETERAVVCHGDFHPGNVLVEDGSVTGVVDWPNIVVAEAAYDVGHTRHLLLAAPTGALPAPVRPLVALLRRVVARRYTSTYLGRAPLDETRVRYFEALAALNRLVEGTMARRFPDELGSGWRDLEASRRTAQHFTRLTGIALPEVTA
ncbi:MAG: phosphotransferase [Dehalococcoidia bacterium]|nr:phosphotransferase [Dehalococcoidia bacterium]